MNGLDWVLAGIGVFSVGRGMWRGAVSQAFGIIGVVGGFLLASHHYQELALRVSQTFPKLTAPQVVSFTVLFLLTWFCVGLLGFLIGKLLRHTGLGFFDRLLGAVMGFAKAVAMAIILISVLTFFLSPQNPLLNESSFAPHIQGIARIIVKATPESVQQLFDQKRKELERFWLDRDDANKKPDMKKKEESKRTMAPHA